MEQKNVNRNVTFGNEYIYVYNKNNKDIKKIGEMSLDDNHLKLYDIELENLELSDNYIKDPSDQELLVEPLEIDDDSVESFDEPPRNCFLQYFNFTNFIW